MKLKYILLNVLIILCAGALLDAALVVRLIRTGAAQDGPWWVYFLMYGFAYLCILPALLPPYCIFARKMGRPDSTGALSALAAGIAYPLVIVLLVSLVLHIPRHALPVAVAVRCFIAALILLGLGTLVSYCVRLRDILRG